MLDGLREAPVAVYLFVLIGIFAAVGVIVNTEFLENTGAKSGFTVYNETLSSSISQAANVSLGSISLTNLSSIIVTNSSEASAAVPSANYIIQPIGTLTGDSFVAFNIQLTAVGAEWNLTGLNITYTGSTFNQAGNAIRNATQGIANITKQLPTVGTVVGVLIVVSAVVGLVGVFSYFRKKEYGGVY